MQSPAPKKAAIATGERAVATEWDELFGNLKTENRQLKATD